MKFSSNVSIEALNSNYGLNYPKIIKNKIISSNIL